MPLLSLTRHTPKVTSVGSSSYANLLLLWMAQEQYPQLCTPNGAYVRMGDKRYDTQLKQQHSLSKAAWCRKDTRKKTALPRQGERA
jgi:hypothetical protein